MKIIERYIGVNLVTLTLVALFALVALFSFFAIIDQLEETGRGSYGVPQALFYVLLTTPRLAYELFPIAAVIGSMTSLGMLAQTSELAIIRTSGVSRLMLARGLLRPCIILVVLGVIIGEFIAPPCESFAKQQRSLAKNEQIVLKSQYGIWTRDGNSYINIRKMLPGDKVEQIYIYEFDRENRLRDEITAANGEYRNGEWVLTNVEQTSISPSGVSKRHMARASWKSLFKPEMAEFELIKPQYMSLWELFGYIKFLKQNAQETQPYEQAFWSKLIRPVTIIAMILLAIPMVNCNSRFTAVGQRVFIGALTGILFHIGDQTAGHLGMVYNINPALSVTFPTLVLLGVIIYLLYEPG
jgi:lipopolysaccharide export system permease protein